MQGAGRWSRRGACRTLAEALRPGTVLCPVQGPLPSGLSTPGTSVLRSAWSHPARERRSPPACIQSRAAHVCPPRVSPHTPITLDVYVLLFDPTFPRDSFSKAQIPHTQTRHVWNLSPGHPRDTAISHGGQTLFCGQSIGGPCGAPDCSPLFCFQPARAWIKALFPLMPLPHTIIFVDNHKGILNTSSEYLGY